MAGVFISYRREDSVAYAGRLYDHLVARFGGKNVFMDTDTLKPGDDFVDTLERTLASCDVLVAVIGRNWLSVKDEKGRQRLEDPADLLRLELVTALNRGIRVIPALVAGARMPTPEELPEALRKLARKQAVVISDIAFHDSAARLLEAIDLPAQAAGAPPAAPPELPAHQKSRRGRKLAFFIGALICALLLGVGGWYLWSRKSSAARQAQIKSIEGDAFSVPELARLYRFPLNFSGRGQTLGLIELGGGYIVSDLDAYFGELKLGPPGVVSESVDRAENSPGSDSDSIVTMNIEIVGAVAPGAQIVVYFAPNTPAGFVDAIDAAVNDEWHHPSTLLIAWGGPEDTWYREARTNLERALKNAADHQITVISSAGDLGPTDGLKDGKKQVDFPDSSPWVLACGGTRLITSSSHDLIQHEVFWNESGRGVSTVFAKPDWQNGLHVAGRAVPDVAADATTRYRVYVHGRYVALGGTAAAASLWAGLLALMNQALGHNVGFLNPILYHKLGPAGALRSITSGPNGEGEVKGCAAGAGWNACTGWGSPDGQRLLEALR